MTGVYLRYIMSHGKILSPMQRWGNQPFVLLNRAAELSRAQQINQLKSSLS